MFRLIAKQLQLYRNLAKEGENCLTFQWLADHGTIVRRKMMLPAMLTQVIGTTYHNRVLHCTASKRQTED